MAKNDSTEKAYYYFLLSQIFTDNLEEVEKNLKKAIELEKKSPFLKKMLLSLYIQTQKFKAAEKLGENLYQKDPLDRDLILLLSKLYLQQNRPNKAISYLENYLEKYPKDNELLSLLISIYLQQKDWDQAL
ncbi:MAG: tetratricopeptide repeat protein, partial [Caldimicrobium sp.]